MGTEVQAGEPEAMTETAKVSPEPKVVTREEFDRLANKLDSVTSRDWRTFFAGFSAVMLVILSVGGVISWGLLDKLDRIETRLSTAEEMIRQHERLSAHPSAQSRIDSVVGAVVPKLEQIETRIDDIDRQLALTAQLAQDIKQEQVRVREKMFGKGN